MYCWIKKDNELPPADLPQRVGTNWVSRSLSLSLFVWSFAHKSKCMTGNYKHPFNLHLTFHTRVLIVGKYQVVAARARLRFKSCRVSSSLQITPQLHPSGLRCVSRNLNIPGSIPTGSFLANVFRKGKESTSLLNQRYTSPVCRNVLNRFVPLWDSLYNPVSEKLYCYSVQ